MFDTLRNFLGRLGTDAAQGAEAVTNTVAAPFNGGHAVISHGAPMHTRGPLPAVGGYLFDEKAVPYGDSPNTAYNQAVDGNNRNLVAHVQPLAVTTANPWQSGSLRVAAPATEPEGSAISPFDTDTQVDPFQFGSRENYGFVRQYPGTSPIQSLLGRD